MTAAILGYPFLSGYAADERKLTGREAEAVALALNTFKAAHRKSPKFYGDLKHYSVSVEREGGKVDVAFVPDPSPIPPNIPKDQWLSIGGGTAYGNVVHYIISLEHMKILDEVYER
jgi:hypothetical protein